MGPFGFLQPMISQLAALPFGGGGFDPNAYTSIYAKTVWVAQDHERATDDRTTPQVLALGDMMHPFQTIQAACDAIAAAPLEFVCIRVASGYYDEIVTLPPNCVLFGEGDQVYITRIVCDGGSVYGVDNIQFYNDADVGSVAPNEAVLYLEGGSVLLQRDVYADIYKNAYTGDPAAFYVTDGASLNAFGCQCYLTQLNTGTNTGTSAAVFMGSDPGTLTLNGGLYQAESLGVGSQNAAGVLLRSGSLAGALVSNGAQLGGFLASNAGSGYAAGVWADGASAGLALVSGGFVTAGVGAGGLGTSKAIVGGALGAGASLKFSGVQATLTPTTAGRHGAGVSGLGNELRVLDMTYPGLTSEPPQVGTLGGVFYSEGVLGNGVRFPAQANQLVSGKTIWVDIGAPLATNTRTGLSKYSRAYPFLSIFGAMAAAVAGDLIQVQAGTYAENVLVTAGVHVRGTPGTILTGGGIAAPTVRLNNGSTVEDFTISPSDNGVTTAAACVRALVSSGEICFAKNIRIRGATVASLTAAGVQLDQVTAGVFVVDGVEMVGGGQEIGVLVNVSTGGGQLYLQNAKHAAPSTGCRVGVLVQSGSVIGGNVVLHDVGYTGIEVQANAAAVLDGVFISGVFETAVRVTDNTSRVNLTGVDFEGCTLDLEVDSGAGSASVFIQGAWDKNLISAPAAFFAARRYAGTAQKQADTNNPAEQHLLGDTGVGTPMTPVQVGITSGLPTVQGLAVLRNTDTDVGTWSNITQDLLDGTPVDLFSALTSVARVYFGCDFPAWAALLGITSGLAPGYQVGVERWNGSAWVAVNAFETEAQGALPNTPPLRRGLSELLQNVGGQYLRWATPSTAPSTLDGITKYWVRVGFTGSPPASPQAALCKMVGAGEVRDLYGRRQYFGGCRPSLGLPAQVWMLGQEWATNSSPTTFSIAAIRGVSMTSPNALFLHTSLYSLASLAKIPPELDPAAGLVLGVYWCPISTAAGNVRFFSDFGNFVLGDVYTAGGALSSVVVTAAGGVANALQTTALTLDIGSVNIPDTCLLPLTLSRDGTNGADTYDNTVIVFAITMQGLQWRD